MQLFSDYERTNLSNKGTRESTYGFLDGSAQPKFARARAILEKLFQEYPPERQAEFSRRFNMADDGKYLGSFFEMYCYALLRSQNFPVIVEARLGGGNPVDCLVGSLENPRFCLEATVALNAETDQESHKKVEELCNALNRIPSNGINLTIEVESESEQNLSYSRICRMVRQWVDGLDIDKVSDSSSDDDDENPLTYVWDHDGWTIRFEVVQHPRAKDDALVSYHSFGVRWVGIERQLRNKLEQKAKQHKRVLGNLQIPYIVAVDSLASNSIVFNDTVREELFGKEITCINPETGESFVTYAPFLPNRPQHEDGYWLGRSGPRNRHVSAVLLVNELLPWSVENMTPILWHNPWAENPLDASQWQGPQMKAGQTGLPMMPVPGETARRLLHLDRFGI